MNPIKFMENTVEKAVKNHPQTSDRFAKSMNEFFDYDNPYYQSALTMTGMAAAAGYENTRK